MDLHKAARDPWVWGQLVLFLLVLVGVPVMTRWVSLGDLDYALNRVGPLWIRVVGGLIAVAGLALARSAARPGAARCPA